MAEHLISFSPILCLLFLFPFLIHYKGILAQDEGILFACLHESVPDISSFLPAGVWKVKSRPNDDTFLVEVAKFAVDQHNNKCRTYTVKYDKTIYLMYQDITDATIYRLLIRAIPDDRGKIHGHLFVSVVYRMPLVNEMSYFFWKPLSLHLSYTETCQFRNTPSSTYELPGDWIAKSRPNSDSHG